MPWLPEPWLQGHAFLQVFSSASSLLATSRQSWSCLTGHLPKAKKTNLSAKKSWAWTGLPFAGVFCNANLRTQTLMALKTSLEAHHISSLFVMGFSTTHCPSNPCVQDHVVGILKHMWKQLHFAVEMLDKMQISCRCCNLCGTKLCRAFIFALVLYTSMQEGWPLLGIWGCWELSQAARFVQALLFIIGYKSHHLQTMNHTCTLLNHSAPHVWGNPASLSTAQKPNREMDIKVRYEKRTNSLGGVSPCTDRNLFKIVSGRSCSPFPYKSSLESCQLPFLYVILCCFWCPRLWHHQNPAALQVSNTSSSSKRLSQLSCLPLVSRPGSWKCFCWWW